MDRKTEYSLSTSRALAEKAAVFAVCDIEYPFVGEPDTSYIASLTCIDVDRVQEYQKMWQKEKALVDKTTLPYQLLRNVVSLYSEMSATANSKNLSYDPNLRFKRSIDANSKGSYYIQDLLREVVTIKNELKKTQEETDHYLRNVQPKLTDRIKYLERIYINLKKKHEKKALSNKVGL